MALSECARAVQVRRRWRRRGGDGSYWCSTPSSRDGVECVFSFFVVGARHRARRCTQVRSRHRLRHRRRRRATACPTGTVATKRRQASRRPPRGARSVLLLARRMYPSKFRHAIVFTVRSTCERVTLDVAHGMRREPLLASSPRLTGRDETSPLVAGGQSCRCAPAHTRPRVAPRAAFCT